MTDMYIYTNKSTPDVINQLADDVNDFIGDVVDAAWAKAESEGDTSKAYRTNIVNGTRGIISRIKGIERPDLQRTIKYADITQKVGATGFFVLNPIWFMENKKTVKEGVLEPTFEASTIALCPNPDDYTGIYFTDDISDWLPPQEF